jgi:hypothetical protein
MKALCIALLGIGVLLAGCGAASVGAASPTPTATLAPTATAPATLAPATVGPLPTIVPQLSASFILVGPGMSVTYLNLREGIAANVQVVTTSSPPGMCVSRTTDSAVTYVQSGDTLIVKSTIISSTPFTINPDGSISHEVPQADGTVTTNTYVPGSNDAYNAAAARVAGNYPNCG